MTGFSKVSSSVVAFVVTTIFDDNDHKLFADAVKINMKPVLSSAELEEALSEMENDTEVYDGEYVEDKRHGHGTLKCANGNVYVGEFKDGKFHGHGTLKYKNGDVYDGDFVNGQRHGHGTFTFKANFPISMEYSIYVGAFANDNFHGSGKLMYSNGDEYIGDFHNGQRHVYGKLTYSNGDVYQGGFKEDKFHCQLATFQFSNGDEYEGKFQKGKFHGSGRYTRSGGDYRKGDWYEGGFVGGRVQLTSECGVWVYQGNYINDESGGRPDGLGKLIRRVNDEWSTIYEGTWKDGSSSGPGALSEGSANLTWEHGTLMVNGDKVKLEVVFSTPSPLLHPDRQSNVKQTPLLLDDESNGTHPSHTGNGANVYADIKQVVKELKG